MLVTDVSVVVEGDSPWVTVLAILATGVITLGTALLVQMWAFPRVERRRRQDELWERNVRELGEFLFTGDRASSSGFRIQLWSRALLREDESLDPEEAARLEALGESRLSAQHQNLREAMSRIRWYVDEIAPEGTDDPVLKKLRGAHGSLFMLYMRLVLEYQRPISTEPGMSAAELNELGEEFAKGEIELGRIVRELRTNGRRP